MNTKVYFLNGSSFVVDYFVYFCVQIDKRELTIGNDYSYDG